MSAYMTVAQVLEIAAKNNDQHHLHLLRTILDKQFALPQDDFVTIIAAHNMILEKLAKETNIDYTDAETTLVDIYNLPEVRNVYEHNDKYRPLISWAFFSPTSSESSTGDESPTFRDYLDTVQPPQPHCQQCISSTSKQDTHYNTYVNVATLCVSLLNTCMFVYVLKRIGSTGSTK